MEFLASPVIALIIKGIQAIIAAAPTIKQVIVEAKQFITNLFSAGLISKETQDQMMAHVDATCEAALAGKLGPEWSVEPDDAP